MSHEIRSFRIGPLLIFSIAFLMGAFGYDEFKAINTARPGVPALEASVRISTAVRLSNEFGNNVALSPDGDYLAFVGIDSAGSSGLYIRRAGSLSTTFLVATGRRAYPFWSPDSKSVAFFSDGRLQKVSVSGGPPVSICKTQGASGGSWGKGGTIVFAESSTGGLYKVSSSGGEAVQFMSPDTSRRQLSLRWPSFMPGSDAFLFTAGVLPNDSASENGRICVGTLGGKMVKILTGVNSQAAYSEGELLYMRGTVLYARPFDKEGLDFKGGAVPVAANVQYHDIVMNGTFSASRNGLLTYETQDDSPTSVILSTPDSGDADTLFTKPVFHDARLSPDGTEIVFDSYDPRENNYDVWTYDIARHIATRLTLDPNADVYPCWSSGGKKILFSSNRGMGGNLNIFIKNKDGSGHSLPFLEFKDELVADQCTPDGRNVLVQAMDYAAGNSGWDLLLVPLEGGGKPKLLLGTKYDEENGRVSPDSKWLLYVSNESGKKQVYVTSLNGSGGNWQVSVNGGVRGKWVDNGREICFVTRRDVVMEVPVHATKSGLTFGMPHRLYPLGRSTKSRHIIYDIANSGNRFLTGVCPQNSAPADLVIISNWRRLLK